METNRIGILTLYKRNYGSALQCYATRRTLEKMSFRPEVLAVAYSGGERLRYYAREACSLAVKSLRYKGYYKQYMSMRRAGKYSISSLSSASAFRLDLFADSVLQVRKCSEQILESFGHDPRFCFFIAGSDQVWSGWRKADPTYFLRFAEKEKRVAFAPSFGTDSVADFNRKSFKKYINGFSALSVREETGAAIIKELTGRDAVRLPDPTVLLDAEDWRSFAAQGARHARPYLFVHFLDTPSEGAIKAVSTIAANRGLDVLAFAYPHKELEEIPGFIFQDGAPEDYVSLIDGAELVCTDSFHSSLFSIQLGTRFIVFPRQYRHSSAQTDRLTTLLSVYGCSERMVESDEDAEAAAYTALPDFSDMLRAERERALRYLEKALARPKKGEAEKKGVPVLKGPDLCTGCGACAAVCRQNAITMVNTAWGYNVPSVDRNKCVGCGRCERVCAGEVRENGANHGAYIAYNRETALTARSASGGVFSALAAAVIAAGGCVAGATLTFENGRARAVHTVADSTETLYPILGSKYVQSDAGAVYPELRRCLENGETVLFGGTSCQVAGLYRYLGKDYNSLYTVDLVCHGVPGEKLFNDYIAWLEKKYKDTVTDFSFRSKTVRVSYEMTIRFAHRREPVVIPWEKSSYYRLFLAMNSYRENCYSCEYANTHKLADITAGDYFEARQDYPELYEQKLRTQNGISCLLVNNEQGAALLERFGRELELLPANIHRIQASHLNLCHPSMYSPMREKIGKIYARSGFAGVERYFAVRRCLFAIPKKLVRLIKKH